MKKKFISVVTCLVFISSMTVSAEAEVHMYDDAYKYVGEADEYLAQLNAGIIVPLNSTITTTNSVNDEVDNIISPYWLWTDCSNVLGHSWSNWSSWSETGSRTHYSGGTCIANMVRYRYCNRTYCSAGQDESSVVWVNCNH